MDLTAELLPLTVPEVRRLLAPLFHRSSGQDATQSVLCFGRMPAALWPLRSKRKRGALPGRPVQLRRLFPQSRQAERQVVGIERPAVGWTLDDQRRSSARAPSVSRRHSSKR
jgi:hypothetical protein